MRRPPASVRLERRRKYPAAAKPTTQVNSSAVDDGSGVVRVATRGPIPNELPLMSTSAKISKKLLTSNGPSKLPETLVMVVMPVLAKLGSWVAVKELLPNEPVNKKLVIWAENAGICGVFNCVGEDRPKKIKSTVPVVERDPILGPRFPLMSRNPVVWNRAFVSTLHCHPRSYRM